MQAIKIEKLDFDVEQSAFTSDHVREFERFNKYKQEECEKHYDECALNYEGVYTRAGWEDPQKCAKWVKHIADQECMMPDQCEILDFGCGTGLVGKYLQMDDFTKVSGIDVSQNMLDIAAGKEAYQELVKYQLGEEEYMKTLPYKLRNRFTFITAAGLIHGNHLDVKIFEQMLICLKKGGYLVFSARFSYIGDYPYVDMLTDLVNMGRIEQVKVEQYFKYNKLNTTIGKFTKTPAKVYVYRKVEGDSILAQQKHAIQRKLREAIQKKYSSFSVASTQSSTQEGLFS